MTNATLANGATAYGQRNIIDLIDERAAAEPSRTVLSLPRSSSDPTQGWEDLSYKDFANAINRFAHWIVKTVGVAKEGECPTIAYLGPNDLRYLIVMAAAIKAGYKVCPYPTTLTLRGIVPKKWQMTDSEDSQ